MKRHDRPWGCTECDKSFGSKGDWKRHENSQHFRHGSWKCHEVDKDGKTCGKITYHPESFKNHLSKTHGITETCDQHLNDYQISYSISSSYWCGFCKVMIDANTENSSYDSWSERFNHIDNHFWGRAPFNEKKSILDWVQEPIGSKSTPISIAARLKRCSVDRV